MDKYRIIPKDKKIFSRLTEDFAEKENFRQCLLNEVIVTPEIKLWKIRLQTAENLNAQLLHSAEVFLSGKFDSDVKIELIQSEQKTSQPVEKKISPPENKNLSGDKIFGKKISGEITDISNLSGAKKSVICGEIGAGEKNGVSFREFKTGSSAVTFALTDKTDGIVCKKIFRSNSKDNAKNLAASLEPGMTVKVFGTLTYDNYAKENIFMIDSVEKIESDKNSRMDNAEV